MPNKRPKGTHNPSQKSLQRWDNEGGAPKGGRAKRPRDPAQLAKLMIDIASGEVEDLKPTPATPATEFARQGGLKGGRARADKLSPERRTEIAKTAAQKRWRKD
jgi:hypothetical protein